MKFQYLLQKGINIIEIIAYTISFTLIASGIILSISTIIINRESPFNTDSFNMTRLYIAKSVTLALSFILGVEMLKIFYINTYKQLIFVISIVLLKLLINYFLLSEIKETIKISQTMEPILQ